MGWNVGFSIMEHTVITLYDEGVLTKSLLDQIMTPYKNTDCDSGGSNDLLSKDGLRVEHIICKIMEPEKTQEVETNPVFYDDFEEYKDSYMSQGDGLWVANEKAYDLFQTIWSDKWGIF